MFCWNEIMKKSIKRRKTEESNLHHKKTKNLIWVKTF